MEICSKKDIKFITGVMAASILLGGCTAKGNNHNHELKEDPNAKTSFNLNEVKVTDYDKDEMDKLYREYCPFPSQNLIRTQGSLYIHCSRKSGLQ